MNWGIGNICASSSSHARLCWQQLLLVNITGIVEAEPAPFLGGGLVVPVKVFISPLLIWDNVALAFGAWRTRVIRMQYLSNLPIPNGTAINGVEMAVFTMSAVSNRITTTPGNHLMLDICSSHSFLRSRIQWTGYCTSYQPMRMQHLEYMSINFTYINTCEITVTRAVE